MDNEIIGNIVTEENIGAINSTTDVFLNMIAIIPLIIYIIGISIFFFKTKKEKILFAYNIGFDIALIIRLSIRSLDGSELNSKGIILFVVIQWIIAIMLYMLLKKIKNKKIVNIILFIYVFISLIFLYITCLDLYIMPVWQ